MPADFVARGTFPLTIDPLVSSFSMQPGFASVPSWGSPDCAFLGSYDGLHAAVFEEAYSQTDHDIYLRPYGQDGLPQPGIYVDYTTDYWAAPQIAALSA